MTSPSVPSEIQSDLLQLLSNRSECIFCYDVLTTQDAVVTSCGHIFCAGCIGNWVDKARSRGASKECPICRSPLNNTFVKVRNGIPDSDQGHRGLDWLKGFVNGDGSVCENGCYNESHVHAEVLDSPSGHRYNRKSFFIGCISTLIILFLLNSANKGILEGAFPVGEALFEGTSNAHRLSLESSVNLVTEIFRAVLLSLVWVFEKTAVGSWYGACTALQAFAYALKFCLGGLWCSLGYARMGVSAVVPALWNALKGCVGVFWYALGYVRMGVLAVVAGLCNALKGCMGGFWCALGYAPMAVSAMVAGLWNALKGCVGSSVYALRYARMGVSAVVPGLWNALKGCVGGCCYALGYVRMGALVMAAGLWSALKGFVGGFWYAFGYAPMAVSAVLAGLWNALKGCVGGFWYAVGYVGVPLLAAVVELWNTLIALCEVGVRLPLWTIIVGVLLVARA